MTAEQRALREMRVAIDKFDDERKDLLGFINHLEDCLDKVADDESDWKVEFLEQWDVLDQALADAPQGVQNHAPRGNATN